MFDFLKKKDKGIEIGAPVKGKAVPISQVSDPTFGEEILGKGVAIQPEDGKIYAPADGTIEMLFDTKHAVSMTTTEGVELLVHIGLDTVALKGEHFTAHKGNGDAVKKGDLLISGDILFLWLLLQPHSTFLISVILSFPLLVLSVLQWPHGSFSHPILAI